MKEAIDSRLHSAISMAEDNLNFGELVAVASDLTEMAHIDSDEVGSIAESIALDLLTMCGSPCNLYQGVDGQPELLKIDQSDVERIILKHLGME